MAVQWLGAIIVSLAVSPYAWEGSQWSTHPHVYAAVLMGGVLSIPPILLALRRPGHSITRHVISVSQVLYSTLLIHLTGGRIETHFHVFGSMAFIALYQDWRLLVAPTLIIAVDHLLRGQFIPRSVFGVAYPDPWRTVEHAGWVIFEDIVLVYACVQSTRELHATCQAQTALSVAHAKTESLVAARTSALKAATDRAESANRAKSDFLANMSHEIRTPMTAILGFTELLTEPDLPDNERRVYISTIRRNGEHLLSVINDVLDVSKIEAGKMRMEIIQTDLRRVLDDVVQLVTPLADAKRISLVSRFPTPLPVRIFTDPTRLRQVVMNLVSNAVKFTHHGSVTITTSLLTSSAAAPLIRIEVADTGIGMDAAQLQRLFRPFSQADESMARRFGGTGLGLHIARSLAELLSGSLAVESTPGRGSTFTLVIDPGDLTGIEMRTFCDVGPAADSVPHADEPAPAEPRDRLDALRVLLVEDGVDNQRLISLHLRRAGAHVEIAQNGRIALDRLTDHTNDFDVVLMDMQMPEMDGYSATSTLRARGIGIPVIALTAHAMTGDRERCLDAGCDDYLIKPVNRAVLIQRCREWATRRAA